MLGEFLRKEWKVAKRSLLRQFLSDAKALFTQNWGKDLIPFWKKKDRAAEGSSAATDEKTLVREGADPEKASAEEERAENAPAEEERTDVDAERDDREEDGNDRKEA